MFCCGDSFRCGSNSDAHTNAHTNTNVDADADANTHANTHTDSLTYTYSNANDVSGLFYESGDLHQRHAYHK